MACFKPITAWQAHDGSIQWRETRHTARQVTFPCSRCIGCRREYSRQWATRCVHEGNAHKHNSVVTLTYADQHLPELGQLIPRHATLFLKRTLKALVDNRGAFLCATTTASIGRSHGATLHTSAKPTFRYYYAGEYGEQWGRPHFHACLFGIDFADKKYWGKTPAGSRIYRSATLEKLWPFGHSSVGELNFESAAYVARYVMKKLTGDGSKTYYQIINPDTGEIIEKHKEFCRMSRRPGIGKVWFDKYHQDWYPEGKLVIRGKKATTPRFYDRHYEKLNAIDFEDTTYGRYLESKLHAEHNTDERLAVRETIARAQLKQLKRKL